MSADTITVVRARGRRLAKRVRADGQIDAYDSARTYDMFTRSVRDLDDLAHILATLLPRPDCAVVRGHIIDPARSQRVRRTVHIDRKTGECPTLEERSRSWLALDLDSADRPAGVAAEDLHGCAAAAVSGLPRAFRGVSCIVQASSSHGLKPGLRLRLWYWLDRPLSGLDCRRWLRGVAVDPTVFRPAQVIYTAAPVFERPEDDPLQARMMTIPGTAGIVHTPSAAALEPPARPNRPEPISNAASGNRYATAALQNAAARVRRAGVGSRHDTVLMEARNLARFVEAHLLTDSEVRRTLIGAGGDAGKPADECDAVVSWAMVHPSNRVLPVGAE